MAKLCGIGLAKNCTKYDYNIKESILSMLAVCDYVIISYIPGEDNTLEVLESIDAPNFKILHLTEDDWNFYNDKNRLSYVTNAAIALADQMGFQYVLYIQADECLSDGSYDVIRRAVESNEEAFFIRRINLWKDCNHQLNVEHSRKPCSTEIIRLARAKYRAYDDAESIAAPVRYVLEDTHIFHYGFVRKKEVMKDKIINMQEGIFSMTSHDAKLDTCEVFNPDLWFSPETDLIPISVPHPKVMTEWISSRP